MRPDVLTQQGPRRIWPPMVFSPHEPAAHERTGVPQRILLVEDDFIVADELDFWLRQAGFEVIGPAATADDAVRLALETKPELVIMDVRLAGQKDGIEAAIQIYRQCGIRSVFATAHSDVRTRERGKAANPLAWMPKPYSPAGLIETIKALLAAPPD